MREVKRAEVEAVVEALRRRLDDPPEWSYMSWPHCTCGHAFHAATGREAHDAGEIRWEAVSNPVFGAAMEALAEAADALLLSQGIEPWTSFDVASRVSLETACLAMGRRSGFSGGDVLPAPGLRAARRIADAALARLSAEREAAEMSARLEGQLA